MSYPQKSTHEAIVAAAATAPPRPKQPAASKLPPQSPQPQPRVPVMVPQSQQKQEDKDSPEWKKRQALTAGPILNMSYQHAAREYDMPDTLYGSVKDLFEAIADNEVRHGVASPSKLVEISKRDNEIFRQIAHHDAHEFYQYLVNTISDNIDGHEKRLKEHEHGAVNGDQQPGSTKIAAITAPNGSVTFPSALPMVRPKSSQWIRDLFEGQLTSETRCLSCENISQRHEPFLDLSVDLEQHNSVTSCLQRFSAEEMLCERNKFHCDNCGGLQEAEKRMKIKKLPKVLTLHLKRFKYVDDYGRMQKLFHKVVYPYDLRLLNTTADADEPDRIYELHAVIVHIGGGAYHGHYVAIVKTLDRGWLLFDDEMVEPVDKSYLKNFFGDRPGLATAYVLFYKETTVEEERAEQRQDGRRRMSQVVLADNASRAQDSSELHPRRSFSPTSPADDRYDSLDYTLTSPPLATNGHAIEPTRSPLVPSLTPTISTPVSKREQQKIEKEKKALEKAQEKAAKKEERDRDKRTQLDGKLSDAARQHVAPASNVVDVMKRPMHDETMDNVQMNGSPSAMDIFKRSKSLRFGSMGRKDKRPEETPLSPNMTDDTSDMKDAKEKKNRFSLRKKSFGILS